MKVGNIDGDVVVAIPRLPLAKTRSRNRRREKGNGLLERSSFVFCWAVVVWER